MIDILDYETYVRSVGVSFFSIVQLSVAILEIYLLIIPVRDLPASPQMKHVPSNVLD